ncbi:fibrinogen C domain-containing protein 1-A-like [Gigantopelta aegis]|uniref:fibrinogen C domain-containing protein 1-A-like n=1 Tax=Gigantopelta aegis TaxID=1735272 RepID=UPI001B88E01A|nr:fibrinogen C domain-containing protein 1-A-like [Gigantopelta aegis]
METQLYDVPHEPQRVLDVPSDCNDIMLRGGDTSGVYSIVPRDNAAPLNVSCELSRNTNIHRITSQGHYDLRIDLGDFQGHTAYALYKDFSLSSEQDYFRLTVGSCSGNAGDSLTSHDGYRFSTRDVDMDGSPNDCARASSGAWWYHDCYESNLNGPYLGENHPAGARGVNWNDWIFFHSLKDTSSILYSLYYLDLERITHMIDFVMFGNTNTHRITSQGHYDLRIDLGDFQGHTAYALYKDFSLSSEQDYLRLTVGQFSGNAGKIH